MKIFNYYITKNNPRDLLNQLREKEDILNSLKNDYDYQNIKIIAINVVALINLLIHKKIITEEEFESAMEIISKFYEETENKTIKKMIDKGEDKNE